MPASITIAGQPYDDHLRQETLHHANALNAEPDTLDFELIDGAPMPPVGAEVVYTLPSGDRLFSGVLVNQPQRKASHLSVDYAPACSDWRHRADAKILNDRLVNKTAGQMLAELFPKYAPEFDTSLIDLGGPILISYHFELGMRLTEAMDALAELTGYIWDIDPYKRVIWQPAGSIMAPMELTDSSFNFTDLTVTVSAEEVKNRIKVVGGLYPAATATVEEFKGLATQTSFRLAHTPTSLDSYLVFEDSFNGLDTAKWVKTSPNNPTPPAGHIPSDGYLFTTLQQGAELAESGRLQVVGGTGVWGEVRFSAYMPLARGDGGRRFELDVYAETAVGAGGLCCLWDPNNLGALAGLAWGFLFDNGTIKPAVGGVAQAALAVVNYAAGKTVRTLIIPKETGGAVLWVNPDDTGDTTLPVDDRVAWRPSQWVKLYETNTGSLANLIFVPVFNHSFNGRVDRAKVFDRLYGAKLEVFEGGVWVEKVLGKLDVDTDSGCYALLGVRGDRPVLVFFPDTKPALDVPFRVTYFRGIPVYIEARDEASIAAMKAIENPTNSPTGSDGIKDGLIKDPAITSIPMAMQRALQEIEQYADPHVTLSYRTQVPGLRAGQVVKAGLTQELSGRDLFGSYLITQV
jgi:hypothetical protein